MSNVDTIRFRIANAAARSGRNENDVTLIAVSKQKPVVDIQTAWIAGVRHFAENRTTELEEKAESLSQLEGIVWHFIGNLQSTHSKAVAQYAHCVHSVDRLRIAALISNQLEKFDRNLDIFVQVNVSGEESKGGFECANWQSDTSQLQTIAEAVKKISALPRLNLLGLMTMAPFNAPEKQYSAIFESTARLSVTLHDALPGLDAHALSMGMSGDFEIAIEKGATHVRIGSAIFGKR